MRTNPRTRQIGSVVSSYETASRFLGHRDKRKLANNTQVERGADDSIGVRLHRTTIVRYYPDGRVQLDSGGWHTVTTKQRISQLLPGMMGLVQRRHDWYVENRYLGTTVPFEDGMIVRGPRAEGVSEEDAYHGNPGDWPGKFADGVEEVLYSFGGESGTLSLPDGGGWWGLELNVTQHEVTDFAKHSDIRVTGKDLARWAFPLHVIIHEDGDGNVDVALYDTAKDAEEAWAELEESLSDDSDGED